MHTLIYWNIYMYIWILVSVQTETEAYTEITFTITLSNHDTDVYTLASTVNAIQKLPVTTLQHKTYLGFDADYEFRWSWQYNDHF